MVTCAALYIWWMLSSSVPVSWRCRHSVLNLFLRMVFASDLGSLALDHLLGYAVRGPPPDRLLITVPVDWALNSNS